VWPLRGSSTLTGRLPAVALVTNFDRSGLTLDELETLLHEFGHALHAILSSTRYAGQAGTNVKLDFVEAPSQMLEEWAYDARVLALFQAVCAACEPVSADLLDRAQRSRSFGKGLQFARQHLYARYDLALHASEAHEPMALWARMEAATPLGHVPGTMFPAAFSHLAGGYGAGYYAYLWSLATAQDLYTAFRADPLDAATGRRYRNKLLAHGGQLEAGVLVTRFLGRAPGNEAFFDWLAR
jgi:thimet oligopeptidase